MTVPRSPRRLPRRKWRLIPASLLAVLLAAGLALAPRTKAFKVGIVGWPPIHEDITNEAIASVMPTRDPLMVQNIQSGVFNTDLSHQVVNAYHFDNSNANNPGFDNGFATLHGMLSLAATEAQTCDTAGNCTINPLFLNPQHNSYRDLVEDISGTYLQLGANPSCFAEPACPTDNFFAMSAATESEVIPVLLDGDPDPDEVVAYRFSDSNVAIAVPNLAPVVADVKSKLDSALGPHCRPDWAFLVGQSPACFNRLEDMAPDDNDFQLLAGHLRIIEYEYQAFYAWQHLGHAFHTTQDFFAHSNYTELVSGHLGPPCDPTSHASSTVCDAALNTSVATGKIPTKVPFRAIPLPIDSSYPWPWTLTEFQNAFNTASMKKLLDADPSHQLFSDANSLHLQTGYFPCKSDIGPGAGEAPFDDGFSYCHTPTGSGGSPGMNKDEQFTSGDQLNHQNHEWAMFAATRMSVALFGAFLGSMPNGQNLMNTNMAMASVKPVDSISWPLTPIEQLAATAASRRPIAVRTIPGQQPPTPLIATRSPIQIPPHIALEPTFARILPAFTHPELVKPNPKPHIFVKLSPNRAFKVGEQVKLEVDALDAASGAALRGLPVAIGNFRGVTGTAIPMTIALSQAVRCASPAGQTVCLNMLAPPAGVVTAPADRYPGGGGNFSLSVVVPQLVATVPGGRPIVPGSQFTVSALDPRTQQPVPGAMVIRIDQPQNPRMTPQQLAATEVVIGAANRPLPYTLKVLGTLQPKRRVGVTIQAEALPASYGSPLIVRAPGYSDQLVHYVIGKQAMAVR
jgi:hypothetical protein